MTFAATTNYGSAAINYSLDNVQRVASELRLTRIPYFHVTGTFGKGSICAILADLLRKQGLRVGRFTSPHLLHPRDCIWINGAELGAAEYDAHMQAIRDRKLSSFERLTVVALLAFRGAVDVAVIEVGMGGLLDATNVMEEGLVAAVIGTIDYDHQEWLGASIESIARHKAGILRPGCKVVVGPQIHASAAIDTAGCDVVEPVYERYVLTHLRGQHQQANAAVAVAAFRVLFPDAPIAAIDTRWPGRLSSVATCLGNVIVDGAHHPHAARRVLLPAISGPTRLVMAMSRGKDYAGFIAELSAASFVDVVCTRASAPEDMPWIRAVDPAELCAVWLAHGQRAVPCGSLEAALGRAAPDGTTTLVCGSLYLVSDFYRWQSAREGRIRADPVPQNRVEAGRCLLQAVDDADG